MPLNVSKTLRKATSLARKGDVDGAAGLFHAVLEQYPQNKQAAQGMASLQQASSRVTAADREALAQDLQHLVRLFNSGDLRAALNLGELMAQRYPGEPLIHNVVGAASKSLHDYDKAIASFTRAIRLKPDYSEAYSNLGAAYHDVGMYEEAIENYARATRHDPNFFEAHRNLGNVLMECGRSEQAIASYQRALKIRPESAITRASLLLQLAQIGDWQAHAQYAQDYAGLGIDGEQAYPFALLHLEDNPASHAKRSRHYANRTFPQQAPVTFTVPDTMPKQLKIGYFSTDFHDHATMYLMARLFELHNRTDFIVHVYSYGRNKDDSMRSRLRNAVDEFHDVQSLEDSKIAQLARSHGLDIAIDLKGYTQYSRPGIFSYRAAPIQMSYLGYPGTLGADFIDYLIADRIVIPPEQCGHYCEKIVYLPHSYQVNDDSRIISDKPLTRAEAGLPEDGFVFCCFNNNYKIGPEEFDVWADLLRQVDGSVLWLLGTNTTAETNLKAQAEERGIAAQRIIFAGRLDHPDHLARHRLADLFLDTFHYNAHTTASDALWAGLPLVTKLGEGFPARVAASLLFAIDLPELVTRSTSEYRQLALDLALDTQRLAAIRTKLAENRLSAPLFDTAAFSRHIEDGFRQAYRLFFEGKAPDTISIDP